MSTRLLYLEDMYTLEADASVERIEQQDGRTIVYLNQTILYPQGGGQPYDTGIIKGQDATFVVDEVRFVDGDVLHYGHFEDANFAPREDVHIVVNGDRRRLNARLHSGGHLVDMAISQLKPDWVSGKGYHFPDGPYVEYSGDLDIEERDGLLLQIEKLGNEFIAQDLPVSCSFAEHAELEKLCRHVPANLPANKPTRVVQFDNFAVPCGGTHVRSLADIKELKITKLKNKGGNIRVGYALGQ